MANKDLSIPIMGGKNGGPLSPEERAKSDAVDTEMMRQNDISAGKQWKSFSPAKQAELKESVPKTAAYYSERADKLDKKPAAKKAPAKKAAPKATEKKPVAKTAAKPAAKKAAPAKKK
jgi:trigger factor